MSKTSWDAALEVFTLVRDVDITAVGRPYTAEELCVALVGRAILGDFDQARAAEAQATLEALDLADLLDAPPAA